MAFRFGKRSSDEIVSLFELSFILSLPSMTEWTENFQSQLLKTVYVFLQFEHKILDIYQPTLYVANQIK